MTGKSMVSAKFYQAVKQSRDALQAHVYRLQEFITSNCYDAPGEASRRAGELLKDTPEQSIAHIQAAALRTAEVEFRKMGYPRAADNLMVMARNLEPGGGL